MKKVLMMHRGRRCKMRRREGITPLGRSSVGFKFVPFTEANPEMWFQLGEETHNKNEMLLETVQQLRDEMRNIKVDNENLRLE